MGKTPSLKCHVKLSQSLKIEKWPIQVNLKMPKRKECALTNFQIEYQYKVNNNFYGILIRLIYVNNISIIQKYPTCSFGKKRYLQF